MSKCTAICGSVSQMAEHLYLKKGTKQECIPVGCVACSAVAVLEGGSAQRGVCLGRHPPPLPWTEFLTHTCENTTFPQLVLRTVIRT